MVLDKGAFLPYGCLLLTANVSAGFFSVPLGTASLTLGFSLNPFHPVPAPVLNNLESSVFFPLPENGLPVDLNLSFDTVTNDLFNSATLFSFFFNFSISSNLPSVKSSNGCSLDCAAFSLLIRSFFILGSLTSLIRLSINFSNSPIYKRSSVCI